MAAISRYKAEQYVTKIFKEYLGALKEAKRNKKKLLPEANILFEGMDEFAGFINSNNLQQKVYNRLNLEGIKELFNEAKLLALYYDLESFTSVKDCQIDTDTPNDFQGWIVRLSSNGQVESIEYKNGNDVLEIFPDGKEEYHKYPGNGSRAGFLARYAGLPVLADGTSTEMENVLCNAGYKYDIDAKKWIAEKNAEAEFDCYGNKIEKIPEPKDEIKKEIYEKYYTIYKKWSKLITGINGNIIELDNGKGKIITTVPYYSQRDNATEDPPVRAGYMCQITSLAMVLKTKGIKQKYPQMQFEDELYKIAKEKGYGGDNLWEKTAKLYDVVIKEVSSDYTVAGIDNGYETEDVKQEIDKGNPVIMSINFKSGGHIIVVVGYTQCGFIVHDPYGNLNKGRDDSYGFDSDGAYVEYPSNKWSIGEKWIRYLSKRK